MAYNDYIGILYKISDSQYNPVRISPQIRTDRESLLKDLSRKRFYIFIWLFADWSFLPVLWMFCLFAI